MTAKVIKTAPFSVQVCVPAGWTDDQAKQFADAAHECGTENGWFVRTTDKKDPGYQARVPCADLADYVHIVLDA